jgi:hypothetical protein
MMSLLVGLQVVEGLQYSLHQLILCSNQLLKVDGVIGVVVVVTRLAIALVVPCVHHLTGRLDKSKIDGTQLYAQGVDGKKCYHFINLIKDEVVNKVLKQSHDLHQALPSMTATSKNTTQANNLRHNSG